ncbi:hypothetical protein N7519_004357 [Penicillium mononematosum]|uniref:uncharacterized protein n=1 Tax=Penicillium mononematosum TaxID=268346 RepID=UPI0025485715|nr:uncharacterized protein N7519_004357 [Penicillium mononematosum]KAJ6189449.1 hypothetical protein N7519_004357 [Penicillium mononematosum]
MNEDTYHRDPRERLPAIPSIRSNVCSVKPLRWSQSNMDVLTVSNVSFSRPRLGHGHDEACKSANRCE